MNTNKIQELSTELWKIAHEAENEIGTPTQGEISNILANCINMLKYATYIIDDAVEIYEQSRPF